MALRRVLDEGSLDDVEEENRSRRVRLFALAGQGACAHLVVSGMAAKSSSGTMRLAQTSTHVHPQETNERRTC